MKGWQKGFLGGFLLGGVGSIPLLWWLSEWRTTFHCPNCDATIAVHKRHRELAPRIQTEEPPQLEEEALEAEGARRENIAVAPTV